MAPFKLSDKIIETLCMGKANSQTKEILLGLFDQSMLINHLKPVRLTPDTLFRFFDTI